MSSRMFSTPVLRIQKFPHLHEGMTVQRKSSARDVPETLTQVGQTARSQDLLLVVQDQSQGHPEEHL